MGCNCGGVKDGDTVVFTWQSPEGPKTFSTKEQAEVARSRAGGHGPILRDIQRAK